MSIYFQHLLTQLAAERRADEAAYLQHTTGTTATQRRTNGLTWYPIAIRSTEPARGDYLSIEVERTTHRELAHQFRFGSAVALFSNYDPANRVNGTISYTSADRMKITLFSEELPDWAAEGKLGIDLLFDAYSYDEMREALKNAEGTDSHLVKILTGSITQNIGNTGSTAIYRNNTLNDSQQEAVNNILNTKDLTIIHGPPGTGKTTTIVAAIKAMVERNEPQLLVVAPSNTAVDLLSERLAAAGLGVLRIGNPVRVGEHLQELTLDSRMASHPQLKDAKKLKKQAAEFKNMAHKYKRSFGKAERDQRKALFDEAHRIMRDVSKIEEFISQDVISKAQVITATMVGANHYSIKNLKFHTLIMDEAGQALEPAAWIPVLKAQRLVMAGDHLQLPPTVKSSQSDLNTTLFEKCIALHPAAVTLLSEQYRMNTAIMGFPNLKFYHNQLQAHTLVANRLWQPDDRPFLFIDTAGAGYEEQSEGTSLSNPEEAAFIARHIAQMAYKSNTETNAQANDQIPSVPSIAVITPYSAQVNLLKNILQDTAIEVNTIDSFQGQERDIVYLSLTRSNPEGSIGFLSDYRRLNVAMTRAKLKLVIVGDSATVGQTPFYADLIAYAESLNGYDSVWNY